VNAANLIIHIPIKLLGDILRWLSFEGSWSLAYPTDKIANHLALSLPEIDRSRLCRQLSQFFFQSRYNKGRINPIFHYALDPKDLLDRELYHDALFQIEMLVDGKKQRANATFYSGRLHSIELPKPIAFYSHKAVQLGSVTRGDPRSTMTRAIDRLEHGREQE
jgi:hypothetical protein